MASFILSNWKAKAASLLLAFAIWYLIDSNLRRPPRIQFPVPGTGTVSPLPDTNPGSVVPLQPITPEPSLPPIPGSGSTLTPEP